MANEFIGFAKCPTCESDKAKLSLSAKTQLAYLTCSACSAQIFARSGRSDEGLRKLLIGAPPADKKTDEKKETADVAPAKDSWDPYA